ncbi:hypothetical protein [Sunxiuqinia rutila]|uniref:hypothetical protein n=1 Tax=Sunxiuqinia rutila TaxID=1397841 RepID=UPI003D369DAB
MAFDQVESHSALVFGIPRWFFPVPPSFFAFRSGFSCSALVFCIPPWFFAFRAGFSRFALVFRIPRWFFAFRLGCIQAFPPFLLSKTVLPIFEQLNWTHSAKIKQLFIDL